MKSRLQNNVAHTLPGTWLLYVVLFFTFVAPLMADDFINISDIKDCRAISDEQERLLCYDTVIDGGVFNEQQVRQKRVEVFGSKTMANPEPPAAATSESSASSSKAEVTESAAVAAEKSVQDSSDRLTVTIVKTRKDGNGFYYFQTAEGQVWKQQNASRWTIDTPFEAVVKAGVMGSFFLEVKGSRGTRVKRVR